MAKFKKNDLVLIIAGREKGKRGRILKVAEHGERLVVEKLNLVKRHQKPTQKHPQGGIIEKESPIHCSNVMLVSPTTNEPFRVRFKFGEQGDGGRSGKSRFNKKNEEIIADATFKR
ncbi:MAG: 50S ribosomal protein L24 [Myxococcales bacterium]|nr:50S ribosomal protein L24 [Myxococcales bacterium]